MTSKQAHLAIETTLKNNTKSWSPWFLEFQKAFDFGPSQFQEIEFSPEKFLTDEILQAKVPHILFFKKDENQKDLCRKVFARLRTLDPAVGILVLTDGPATGRDTMSWLDIGATALVSFDMSRQHLNEALKELFASRILNHELRTPRVPAKHKIVLQMASLEQAIVAETLNVGMGGMFIRVLPQGAKNGDLVDFEFVISKSVGGGDFPTNWDQNPALQKMEAESITQIAENKSPARFTGNGTIVWVRTQGQKNEPEGIGVQYLELEKSTQDFLMTFIKVHGFKSFIPRS